MGEVVGKSPGFILRCCASEKRQLDAARKRGSIQMANLDVLAVSDGRGAEFEAENAELRNKLARLANTNKTQKGS